MYKELIIIVVVIALVVGLDVISNNYTKASVKELSDELNNLRAPILEENKEDAQKQMQNIKEKWKERYNVLAYYIEHDELEKVETELVRLSANIDVEEYEHCIEEIEASIFILEHIQQKEKFDIISVF